MVPTTQRTIAADRIARKWWTTALVLIGLLISQVSAFAQEKTDAEKSRPVRFLTVQSPLSDAQVGRVQNAALEVQTESSQQDQQGLLILEIEPGTSEFFEVLGLADFLTTKLPNVTTVAWIPETVMGNNVVLALACQEIVMSPEAELGDIGRGNPLEENRQKLILDLIAKSNNIKVSEGLVQKMMNRDLELIHVTLEQGEKRAVTQQELDKMLDNKEQITKSDTILEQGELGVFSGAMASRREILVSKTATNLAEVAEIYGLKTSDLREAGDIEGVRLIKVEGTIEPMMAAYIQRLINRAVNDGVNLIIFEVDSPGGYMESMWELRYAITDLTEKKVRTVAYIPKLAMSAAAVISLSCDEVYLHPDALIGDAGPITIREGQAFEHVEEKQLSAIRGLLKALAEEKHLPSALVESMADRNLVVYKVRNTQDGRIWYMSEAEIHEAAGEWEKLGMVPESEKGNLLTATGKRAHEMKLAEPTINNIDELKQRLGLPAETDLSPMQENWVDTLIFKLNTPAWTGTLFTVAMLCLFLELHLMTGLLSIISGLCFALFFWSRYMGGTAGALELILFVGGLICLALEVFVIPGFGVFGISGGLMVLASLILASQTFGDAWGSSNRMESLTQTAKTLTISIGVVVLVSASINRYLPHIPILNAIVLHPPNPDGDSNGPKLRDGEKDDADSLNAELFGMKGTAQSVLRPAGKARIGERLVNVVSNGPFINPGTKIEVVEVTGNRVVVREV